MRKKTPWAKFQLKIEIASENSLFESDTFCSRRFVLFDYNGDGLLDWKEIMAALCTLRAPGEDALRFCSPVGSKDVAAHSGDSNFQAVFFLQ